MSKPARIRMIGTAVGFLVLAGLGWWIYQRSKSGSGPGGLNEETRIAPVEVAVVEHGLIQLRRTFSGTLEAPSRTVVAPKVGGRLERLSVDLADSVKPGQVLAELDDDEYVQAVNQARADLEVARANLAEARSSFQIAERELERVKSLQARGVSSDSQYDTAMAQHLARAAAVEVAEAQVTRAEASLASAQIKLGYTKVTASWVDGGDRVVGERFVDEGDTVAANTRLLSIVELNPILAVVFVTEKDYGRLRVDQPATLTTDAFPEDRFEGRVTRIAPVFRQASRQARVELLVDNQDHLLKPGMFVRVEVVLDRAENAVIVPVAALETRGGQTGVFVVNTTREYVSWRQVRVGIRDDERVQVIGDGIEGLVVTLGQQLIGDGSKITIPDPRPGGGESEDLFE